MEEQALPGGYVTEVVRVGDTVRRTPPPDPAFVHELLGLFERRGWPGAPRFLGHDEQGREVLTYVAGHVAWAAEQPATVTSPASLAQVAELVREFHDLTAGTPLAGDPGGGLPQRPVAEEHGLPRRRRRAGPGGVHRLGHRRARRADPRRRLRVLAVPGPRPGHHRRGGGGPGPAADLRRLRPGRPGPPADTIWWWQDRCWRGIEAGAAAGDPAMAGLRDRGAADSVRAAADWVKRHRAGLDAALAA